jgi:hypothetical protein
VAHELARVDLFTAIHKGLRVLLFDLTAAAARLDHQRSEAVDVVVAEVERAIGFLDEHAEHEERHVAAALRGVAPEVEAALAAEHRALEARHRDAAAAAFALAGAAPVRRGREARRLCHVLDQLTAAHLLHMHREETAANQALWGALDDLQLMAIRARLIGGIAPARLAEWRALVLPALDPTERRLLTTHPPAPPAP